MRLLDLDATALARHGLITRESSGMTHSAWYRGLASGQFEQIHPGVARLAGTVHLERPHLASLGGLECLRRTRNREIGCAAGR